MALVLKNRVKEETTTTGTGAFALGGASAQFDTFQTYMSNGDTTYYSIAQSTAGTDEWEIGIGTWNTGNTLSRTTVLAGSNGTSAVDFGAGTKEIFMTYPADKAIFKDGGDRLNLTAAGTANNPSFSIDTTTSGTYVHSQENFAANLTQGQTNVIVVGKEGSTKNSGYIGYNWDSAGSDNNYVSLGHWGNNHIMKIYGSGNIAVTGTVDGRDLAADGTKLDGIESGATADQTASEIRTLVESASDSNVFTDADHTKLNNIEANATADQTASEILTAIKTVDGSGSGLDADTLDGVQASSFLRSDASDSHSGTLTLDVVSIGNEIRIPSNTSLTDVSLTGVGDENTGFNWSGSDAVNYISGGVLRYNMNNVWHSGNDGSGSGLDADTVDGIQASSFLRSDANDTSNSTITMNTLKLGDGNDGRFFSDTNGRTAFADGDFYIQSNVVNYYNYAANQYLGAGSGDSIYCRGNTISGNSWSITGAGAASFGGTLTLSQDGQDVLNFSANDTNDNRGIAFNSRTALSADYNDGWLRLNSASEFSNGLYTPGGLRVDGTLQMGARLAHVSDSDTYIDFATNDIHMVAGGHTELYITTTGVRLGDTGNGYFQPVSGNYGSIQVDGGAHGGWEGYSIGGRVVFMHDNSSGSGIYNDVNNEWMIYCQLNNYVGLYYNGAVKLQTTSGGISVTGSITASSNITAYSDQKLKDNIEIIENPVEKVKAIQGITYNRNDLEDRPRQTGVIAQQVEKVLPEVVQTDDEGIKTVAYGNMVGLLVEAIKEQQKQIDELKDRLA